MSRHQSLRAAFVLAIALAIPGRHVSARVIQTATYSGHTYYLLDQGPWWSGFEAEAVSLGGHLVTINDQAENDFIFNTFGPTVANVPGRVSLFVGLNDVQNEGQFVWASGEPVTFTNWAPSQPEGGQPDEDYGGMLINFLYPGKWHDVLSDDRAADVVFGVAETVAPPQDLFYDIWRSSSSDLTSANSIARWVTGSPSDDPALGTDPSQEWFYWLRATKYEQSGLGDSIPAEGCDSSGVCIKAIVNIWYALEAGEEYPASKLPIGLEIWAANVRDNAWQGRFELTLFVDGVQASPVLTTPQLTVGLTSSVSDKYEPVENGFSTISLEPWAFSTYPFQQNVQLRVEIRVVGGFQAGRTGPVQIGHLDSPPLPPRLTVEASATGPTTFSWSGAPTESTGFSLASSTPGVTLTNPTGSTTESGTVHISGDCVDSETLAHFDASQTGVARYWATGHVSDVGELAGTVMHGAALGDIDLVYGDNIIALYVFDSRGNSQRVSIPITRVIHVVIQSVAFLQSNGILDHVTISWQNPVDTRFDGVRVVRREDQFPENENDGDQIYEGNDTSCNDNNAQGGRTYFYAIFPFQEEALHGDGHNGDHHRFFYSVADDDARRQETIPADVPDSDGDGVPNACDSCPNTIPGASVDAHGCPPVIPGDFDRDGDVDQADLAAFVACASDPAIPVNSGCTAKDLDGDTDADQSDFGILQRHFSGEDVPADPAYAVFHDMVLIPAGEFLMGDSSNPSIGWPDERPAHVVALSAFYMDRFELTNQQYAEALNWAYQRGDLITVGSDHAVYRYNSGTPYCDTTASSTSSRIKWDGTTFSVYPEDKKTHPTVGVRWYGAVAYANWRSMMGGRPPCYDVDDSRWPCDFSKHGYRLPTEAEWEYAARGGLHSPYYDYPWPGNYPSGIDGSKANYWLSGDPFETTGNPRTAPVGYYSGNQVPSGVNMPNGYGLYDMAGNVWEWCNDWLDFYSSARQENPHGPPSGYARVYRGGSWQDIVHLSGTSAWELRCACRACDYPDNTRYLDRIGLRLVLDAE